MAILNRATSGLILEESIFNHNLLWDLSPNDYTRIACNSDSVELEHGDQRISMSIQTPSKSYVFQTEIKHEPVVLSDVGGIVISSTTDNAIECQTFFTYNGGSAQYFRFIKVCVDKEVYTFYGSMDGVIWQDLGNSKMLDANRIGFFLDGIKTVNSKKFMVKSIYIYNSNIVTFNNIPNNSTIRIVNQAGYNVLDGKESTIKRYNNKCFIDFTNVILPIEKSNIEIIDPSGKLIASLKNITLYGGDIYEYSENIQFMLNDVVIDPRNSVDLGRLTSKENKYLLTVKNLDSNTLIGKTLKVEAYSDYYRGSVNTKLAIIPDITSNQQPQLTYADKVSLPDMPKDKLIQLNMVIVKDRSNLGPFLADKYKFKIVFE